MEAINFDAGKNPVYKMSLRDIIHTFMNYNPVDRAYWIKEDDDILNTYPTVEKSINFGLEDNEKFITSFDKNRFFINTELKNIHLWKDAKFTPYTWANGKGTSKYFITGIQETENGIMYECDKYKLLKNNTYKKVKPVLKFEDELSFSI